MHSLVVCSLAPKCQILPIVRRFFNRSGAAGTAAESTDVSRARLLYQSRKRGIRENDILIGGFAEQHLAHMDEHELEQYDRVINGQHSEWDLFHYFTGVKEAPSELNNNVIFQQMRQHVMSKKSIRS